MSSVDDQTSGHTPSETSSEELQEAGSQVEENEEDPYTPLTLDEIPDLLKDLESTDETVALEAATKLDAACMRQEEFMAANFLALDVARTIHLANQKAISQALRYSLVDYLASLCNTHPDLRAHFAKFIPNLVPLIAIPGESHLYRLAFILNAVTEDIPTSHPDVLSALKALYQPILQALSAEEIDSDLATPLIASFTTMFVYGSDTLQRLFVEAKAVAAVIVSSHSSSPPLRLAVAYALSTLAEHADKIREWSSDEDKELKEQDCLIIVMSLAAAFTLLDGTNREVDDQAIDFIHGMQDQYAPYVCALLEEKPNMRKFLLTLAGKPANTLNSRDHMLMKACEIEDIVPLVVAGFKDIWQDPTVPVDVITQLFVGLSTSFLDHRKYACQDGLSELVIHRFATTDETDKMKLFNAFNEFMEEQMVGGYLLKSDAAIRVFIDGLKDPISQIRTLSSSILRKVIDSHLDDVSQRPIAVQRLTEPENLALILDVVRTPDPISSSAGFELLGDILAGEEGTESFGYDEDDGLPPPSSPLKDLIVTPDLVQYAVSLLHKKETAVAALNFLSYACWGYARGREVTRDAFKPIIPTADVFFFDNLYGDFVSRASGRRKRAVAQAAVDAGAFERVSALLEQDYETVEERRAAVEGFRVIVAAPEMDTALARNSTVLPRAVGRLVADGTFLSLKHAQWAINLASNDDDPDTFAGWGDFASPEVVRALTNGVSLAKEELPEVERVEGMSEEEFVKLQSEWRQKVVTAEEEYTTRRTVLHEIMTRLAPVLKPFAKEIVGPVFEEGAKSDDYLFLQLANIYGGVDSSDVPSEELLTAVEKFLATGPPLSICQSVISAGPACATALQIKGLATRLLDSLSTYPAIGEGDEEEEDLEATPRDEPSEILTLLSGILSKIDDARKPEIQRTFFASLGAISQTCKLIADRENVYEAFSVAGCLWELLKDYPEGVKALDGTGVYDSALRLFDHKELEGSEDAVAGLVAALCCLDEAKLVDLIQRQIAQLQPPAEPETPAANGGKKGGKKGGGKKKKYKPRLSENMVWLRITALADTTSAAKKVLLDAGAIEFAKRSIIGSKADDVRTAAILLLTRIADGNKDSLSQFSDIIHLLTPSLVEPDETTEACLVLINHFIDQGMLDVIFDACAHDHILKLCSANPVERDLLFAALSGLLKQEAGYAAVLASLQADIADERTLEDEKSWGYSTALRQLAERDPGVEEKRLFGEQCVIDHTLRLLNTTDPQLITKGAMLAGDLCFRLGETARTQLDQIGVSAAFVEEKLKLVEAAVGEPFETELEGDEADEARAEHTRLLRTRKDYLPLIKTSIILVSGGEVVDYTPEYGI